MRRILFLFLLLPFFSAYPARAELTCDGRPIPYGKVCCQGGSFCDQGNMCVQEGGSMKCLPTSSPRACANGKYCDKDSVCAPEGGCLSVHSERYCGGRSFCKVGAACLNDKTCLSVTSERYCGNRKYCDVGQRCVGDGKCQSISVSSTPGIGSAPGGSSSHGKPTISNSCLQIGESKRVGGMIGECIKKDGSNGHFYFTMVRSTGGPGCPKDIEFDYLDSDDGSVPSYFTPFNVQTCDQPPSAIEVKE
jgi:hypothetical protein